MGRKVTLKISATGTRGEGIAYHDGLTCFVPFCLPGEEVEAEIVSSRGGVADARLVKVLKSVNGRVKPRCALFGKCGGCDLQFMSYETQLEFKRRLVKNNLRKIGGIDFEPEAVVPSDMPFGYRNKLQVPFGKINGQIVSGFYAAGTHDIVAGGSCPLQDGWADLIRRVVAGFAADCGVGIYDEKSGRGLLRHLVARYIDGQLLAAVVINGDELPMADELERRVAEAFDRYGLFVNVNKKRTNVIMGGKTIHVGGIRYIESMTCGVKYRLQPESFFQINDNVRDKLYAAASALVSGGACDNVIDAFSGVGVLSGVLAKSGARVYGIEIVPQAVADADSLKQRNGITNLTNICGDVNVELVRLCQRLKGQKTALVFDPPRKGLAPETKAAALAAEPEKIVYISCDSATLARDIKDLSAKYKLETCRPFDMFPQTAAVETLCLLTRNRHSG